MESICTFLEILPEHFHAHFESKQAAVLCAVEEFADRVIGDCTRAAAAAESWPQEIWAASTVFTDWGACEPCFARLGIVEMAGAGRPAQVLMGELLETFAMFLRPGYEQSANEELKMGSLDKQIGERLNAMLSEHIRRHSAKTLPRIAPNLTRAALAPFIGSAKAERFVEDRLAEER